MSSGELSGCLSEGELQQLLTDRTAPGQLESAAAHLESCPACRDRLERLAGGSRLELSTRTAAADLPSAALAGVIKELHNLSPVPELASAAERSSDAPYLSPPVRLGSIGRFGGLDILQRVASGGMGVVYKAKDPALNRIVAVKILAPALAASESARSRFLREARAAAAVVHENVVAIHAVGEENGIPYLVMHFVQGKSLQARLAAGPLELKEILRIGMQTARGLAAAHAQGLIHRDIKPGNILLENSVERVQLTDFGLARAVDDPGSTRPGILAGTPEYMSPEQARGERIDMRSDLFSLGSVLYVLAAGQPPFLAKSTLATLKRVCDAIPAPPHLVNPAVPAWLSEIILRLLAKDPRDRFQTAPQVARVLETHLAALQSGLPLPPRDSQKGAAPASSARSRWALPGLVTLASLALVLAGLRGLAPSPRKPTPAPAPAAAFTFTLLRGSEILRPAVRSLQEAVQAAAAGDIIEIGGAGSMLCDPVTIRGKSLRLRASTNGSPVLINAQRTAPLVSTDAPLILEGLELRAVAGDSDFLPWLFPGRMGWAEGPPQAREGSVAPGPSNPLIRADGAPLILMHCRLVGPSVAVPGQECIHAENVPRLLMRNCDLYHTPGPVLVWNRSAAGQTSSPVAVLRVENSLILSRDAISLQLGRGDVTQMECQRSTFVGGQVFSGGGEGKVTMEARHNLFDVASILRRRGAAGSFPADRSWRGVSNFYSLMRPPRGFGPRARLSDPELARNLAAVDTGSVVGEAGLRARLNDKTGGHRKMSAAEFRLHEGGVQAPAELPPAVLREFGADPERIGPGAPYQAWRQSAEYAAFWSSLDATLR